MPACLAHAYRARLVGLSTRTYTGWLDVADDGTTHYAPHTAKGFVAPPNKHLLLVANGLLSKVGLFQARRHGTVERLQALAEARGAAVGADPAGQGSDELTFRS